MPSDDLCRLAGLPVVLSFTNLIDLAHQVVFSLLLDLDPALEVAFNLVVPLQDLPQGLL